MTRPPATPWTVRGSRHVLQDRWISVRADSCISDEGTEFDPYYVLEYPDWVQVIALTDAEEIVMVDLYRHGMRAISRELPTGQLNNSGEDPVVAAQRELAEETGYSAREWTLLASLPANPANQPNRCHVVLATGAWRAQEPADDPFERVDTVLLPARQVAEDARAGRVGQIMHVAGLALALTPLGLWT